MKYDKDRAYKAGRVIGFVIGCAIKPVYDIVKWLVNKVKKRR